MNFNELPNEIIIKVFDYLSDKEKIKFRCISKFFEYYNPLFEAFYRNCLILFQFPIKQTNYNEYYFSLQNRLCHKCPIYATYDINYFRTIKTIQCQYNHHDKQDKLLKLNLKYFICELQMIRFNKPFYLTSITNKVYRRLNKDGMGKYYIYYKNPSNIYKITIPYIYDDKITIRCHDKLSQLIELSYPTQQLLNKYRKQYKKSFLEELSIPNTYYYKMDKKNKKNNGKDTIDKVFDVFDGNYNDYEDNGEGNEDNEGNQDNEERIEDYNILTNIKWLE
jgi:hypothetical protein